MRLLNFSSSLVVFSLKNTKRDMLSVPYTLNIALLANFHRHPYSKRREIRDTGQSLVHSNSKIQLRTCFKSFDLGLFLFPKSSFLRLLVLLSDYWLFPLLYSLFSIKYDSTSNEKSSPACFLLKRCLFIFYYLCPFQSNLTSLSHHKWQCCQSFCH